MLKTGIYVKFHKRCSGKLDYFPSTIISSMFLVQDLIVFATLNSVNSLQQCIYFKLIVSNSINIIVFCLLMSVNFLNKNNCSLFLHHLSCLIEFYCVSFCF
jgi:hypothetical protein